MNKTICEPIKIKVDSLTQLYHLIDASISNYDIYIKEIKQINSYSIEKIRYEVSLYERNKNE